MCLGLDKPSPRTARAGDSQPSIDTEDGNVIIAVNGAGDQIGFRIGGKVTYFDEMATDIRGQIPAVNLGYNVGVASGKAASASVEILDYLKTDLSDRVEKIDGAQGEIEQSVQRSLDAAKSNTDKQLSEAAAASKTQLADQKSDVDTKISALSTKVAADLKTTTESIDKSVTAKVASVGTYGKSLICLNSGLKFNPATGECCKYGYQWDAKDKKCMKYGSKENPGINCLDIMTKTKATGNEDGKFWLKPTSIPAFEAYCTFKGDYPGSVLAMRKPGHIPNHQTRTGALGGVCDLQGGDKSICYNDGCYCKLSDAQINAYKSTSKEMDPYIVMSYKNSNTEDKPHCRGFAKKTCNWNMRGNERNCANSVVRNSGQYCDVRNRHGGYRGIDGYICQNLNYNTNANKFKNTANSGGISQPSIPFIIFEHGGGSHYCGGHDTTWKKIYLWIQ